MDKGGYKGGPKTPGSGRQKGSVNRTSLQAAAMLEANGFNPDLPWLYWARVLTSHLAPRTGRGSKRVEEFYQGTVAVSQGAGKPAKVEQVWTRASAGMASRAATELAKYVRPQLMRVEGTGHGGAMVIEFAEDHTKLGTPGGKGSRGEGPQASVRVEVTRRRVKRI